MNSIEKVALVRRVVDSIFDAIQPENADLMRVVVAKTIAQIYLSFQHEGQHDMTLDRIFADIREATEILVKGRMVRGFCREDYI